MTVPSLRLDKWLWHARFVKSRNLVHDMVRRRRVRLNDQLVAKIHQPVRPGDVLTLIVAKTVLVLRVEALGTRRGPASEAQTLYMRLNDEE